MNSCHETRVSGTSNRKPYVLHNRQQSRACTIYPCALFVLPNTHNMLVGRALLQFVKKCEPNQMCDSIERKIHIGEFSRSYLISCLFICLIFGKDLLKLNSQKIAKMAKSTHLFMTSERSCNFFRRIRINIVNIMYHLCSNIFQKKKPEHSSVVLYFRYSPHLNILQFSIHKRGWGGVGGESK